MRRMLAVTALLSIIAITTRPAEPNQSSGTENPDTQKETPSTVTFADNEKTEQASAKYDEHPPTLYASLKNPEWWLVAAAVLTLLMIYRQAKEMGKATQEMKKSVEAINRQAAIMERQTVATEQSAEAAKNAADAANLNAKALINVERAWIEVYLKLAPKLGIAEHSSSTTVNLEFTCTNYGKTPAWINTAQIGIIILREHIAAPDSLPTTMDFPLIGPELVAAGKDMSREGHVLCEGRITKDHPALVYGKVSYFDILHEPRITTFGFWISEDRKLNRLPFLYPAYNEHT